MKTIRNILLLLTLTLSGALLQGCSDDDPTSPGGPSGPAILVLGDGGTEDHVIGTLKAAGMSVKDGGLLHNEWLNYSVSRSNYHQTPKNILPTTIETGEDSQFSVLAPRSGATQLVRGNRSGAAIVTWTKGGRAHPAAGAGAGSSALPREPSQHRPQPDGPGRFAEGER